MRRFNVHMLIQDCGGPRAVARDLGVSTYLPWYWRKHNVMKTTTIEQLLHLHPDLYLDDYFGEEKDFEIFKHL